MTRDARFFFVSTLMRRPRDKRRGAGYRGVVVEHRDRPVRAAPHVVLERERRGRVDCEVALHPPETPQDVTALAVDLVDRRRVPRRDEEIPIRVEGDRVEMEIVDVPRRRDLRHVRLVDTDVLVAPPFEQHAATRDVDLLDDPGDEARHRRRRDLAVDGDERSAFRRQQQLVQIAVAPASGLHRGDLVIGRVEDDPASAFGAENGALVPGQHGAALVLLHAHVHRGGRAERKEPQGLPGVVDHERAGMALAVRCRLVRARGGGDVERREEDRARSRAVRGEVDRQRRRQQVGTAYVRRGWSMRPAQSAAAARRAPPSRPRPAR